MFGIKEVSVGLWLDGAEFAQLLHVAVGIVLDEVNDWFHDRLLRVGCALEAQKSNSITVVEVRL